MIPTIKAILAVTASFVLGAGFWYLIFWFVTSQSNMLDWWMGTKIIYLLFAFTTSSGIVDEVIKNK